MSTASFSQISFRFRNDDGNETAATWRQVQNTNDTIALNTPFRLRIRIDETASVAWTSKVWAMRVSINGGVYSPPSVAQCPLTLSANFAQNDNCTTQLTGGTGTFVATNAGMQESGNSTNSGTAGQIFEIETCMTLSSAGGANVGDTFDFRIYDTGAAIAVYTVTPRMTAIASATRVPRPFNYQPFLAQ